MNGVVQAVSRTVFVEARPQRGEHARARLDQPRRAAQHLHEPLRMRPLPRGGGHRAAAVIEHELAEQTNLDDAFAGLRAGRKL